MENAGFTGTGLDTVGGGCCCEVGGRTVAGYGVCGTPRLGDPRYPGVGPTGPADVPSPMAESRTGGTALPPAPGPDIAAAAAAADTREDAALTGTVPGQYIAAAWSRSAAAGPPANPAGKQSFFILVKYVKSVTTGHHILQKHHKILMTILM